jgi:hypothetical protein
VLKIEHDDSGKVTGVLYADKDGNQHCAKGARRLRCRQLHREPAAAAQLRLVDVPDGLANSSGQVGRNYMRHMTGSVYAVFDKPVNMYRGTTMAGIIQDESRHDPSRGFVGGYEMETLSLGLPFMAAFLDPGGWGRDFDLVDGLLREHGRHVACGRGHAAGNQPHHPARHRSEGPIWSAGAECAFR